MITNVATNITFNRTLPKMGQSFDSPIFEDIPSFKYADYDFVLRNCPDDICQIIKGADIVGDHKKVVVDIKVHDLEVGNKPAINGWHIDCTNNPLHNSRPEHHHVFVVGKCLTEFPVDPISLNVSGVVKDFDNLVSKDIQVFQISSNTFYSYGRFDLHRASVATQNEKRLLIRITETDIIKSNNRPYEPYVKRMRPQRKFC